MEDAQASFQVLRLSTTSRLSHLLFAVPPSIKCQAAADYYDLVEWALASIIDGERSCRGRATNPRGISPRSYLVPKSDLSGTRGPMADPSAFIGCHALVLERIVAASARRNLPSLLERLPERPMALALLEKLKTVATEVKTSQIEDAVGSSWAALTAEEDPQRRGIWTLLVEAGTGGEGGRGRGEGRGGRGAGCVEPRKQREDPLATQPEREGDLSQTTEGPEEGA